MHQNAPRAPHVHSAPDNRARIWPTQTSVRTASEHQKCLRTTDMRNAPWLCRRGLARVLNDRLSNARFVGIPQGNCPLKFEIRHNQFLRAAARAQRRRGRRTADRARCATFSPARRRAGPSAVDPAMQRASRASRLIPIAGAQAMTDRAGRRAATNEPRILSIKPRDALGAYPSFAVLKPRAVAAFLSHRTRSRSHSPVLPSPRVPRAPRC